MKRKMLTFVLVVVAALVCSACLLACGNGNGGEDKVQSGHTHEYENYVYNNDATCGKDGTETAKCKYCDKTDTRTKGGTATGEHLFENYTYNNDATCDKDGTETGKCKFCDKTDTRTKGGTSTGKHEYEEYVCSKCNSISPDAPITDGLAYSEIKSNNIVVGYSVSKGEAVNNKYIKIPNEYNNLPVIRIGRGAFSSCSGLTSIEIPNSVTRIEEDAFWCKSLTSITYTGDIKSWCEISGLENLMAFGSGHMTLTIGGKVITGELIIPTGVTSIGDYAFQGCSRLTSVTIPTGVTSINHGVFSGCSSLTSITIPNSVTNIWGYAFQGCNSLTSITIPNSVTSIGYEAFRGCSNLTNVSIGNGVTAIYDNAFRDCSSLTSVLIGNSLKSIGDNAFRDCSNLAIIEIPNSLERIGTEAFYMCRNLQVNEYNNCTYLGNNENRYVVLMSCKSRSLTSYSIHSNTKVIYDNAFCFCALFTRIDIPNSVMSIGYQAFDGCSSLTSITIPNSVTSIWGRAFCNCSSLTSITIPNSVTSIGACAFYDCKKLTIYCEVSSKPSGWDSDWNRGHYRPVVWGYKG